MLLNETNVTCVVAFLLEICESETPSKVLFFLKTLDFFLWANHGHGGHGNGVRRGFLGMGFQKKKYPRGVAGQVFKKTPVFGVRLPKLGHLTVWRVRVWLSTGDFTA